VLAERLTRAENGTVATALLSDLVERGQDPEQGILFVLDGVKALRRRSARHLAGGDDSPRGDGGDGFLLSLVQLAARTPSGDTA
jgi:hypothetical protein